MKIITNANGRNNENDSSNDSNSILSPIISQCSSIHESMFPTYKGSNVFLSILVKRNTYAFTYNSFLLS